MSLLSLRIFNYVDGNKETELRVNMSSPPLDHSSNNMQTHQCLIVGLPCEMTQQEFLDFLEPFLYDIVDFQLIQTKTGSQNNFELIELQSRCSLLTFLNEDTCQNFSLLYNNLHFPTHRTAPPCMVIPINNIETVNVENSCSADNNEKLIDSLHGQTVTAAYSNRVLPLCSVCLRRLKTSVTTIPGSNEVPVNTKYAGNGLRCIVCRVYGGIRSVEEDTRNLSMPTPTQDNNSTVTVANAIASSATEAATSISPQEISIPPTSYSASSPSYPVKQVPPTFSPISQENRSNTLKHSEPPTPTDWSKLRSCLTCNLRENIWVCMTCAHTGCGRYTSQHAKNHHDLSGHPFSLELASGRIWDYDFDTFVHVESEQSSHLSQGAQSEETLSCDDGHLIDGAKLNCKASIDSYRHSIQTTSPHLDYYGKAKLVWSGQSSIKSPGHRLRSSSFDEVAQAWREVDPIIRSKLEALVDRYEKLLETQLRQQAQHFEKQLSKETASAFYSSIGLNSSSTDYSQIGYGGVMIPSSTESGSALESSAINSLGLTDDDDLNDRGFAQIVQAKLEISAIEYETTQLIDRVRTVEREIRQVQKENDALMKRQHEHQSRLTSLDTETTRKQLEFEQTVAELEQQVRDLSFYTRTRLQLRDTSSSIKSEVLGAQVMNIIGSPSQGASALSSMNVNGNESSASKKKKTGKNPKKS